MEPVHKLGVADSSAYHSQTGIEKRFADESFEPLSTILSDFVY